MIHFFIVEQSQRSQLSPSAALFCGQILSLLDFSRTNAVQPLRKLLSQAILAI
jgi:hypothetical protein